MRLVEVQPGVAVDVAATALHQLLPRRLQVGVLVRVVVRVLVERGRVVEGRERQRHRSGVGGGEVGGEEGGTLTESERGEEEEGQDGQEEEREVAMHEWERVGGRGGRGRWEDSGFGAAGTRRRRAITEAKLWLMTSTRPST